MPESPFDFNDFPADPTSWLAREHRNPQTEQDLHQRQVPAIKTENDDYNPPTTRRLVIS